MAILTQQISNHSIFTDVERYVDVYSQLANSLTQTFEFNYVVRYIKDGEDITNQLAQPANLRIFTNGSTKQLLRDENFQPIPNPNFNEADFTEENPATDYDKYQWVYGWDLVMTLIAQPTNITEMIKAYILENDAEHYFDS